VSALGIRVLLAIRVVSSAAVTGGLVIIAGELTTMLEPDYRLGLGDFHGHGPIAKMN